MPGGNTRSVIHVPPFPLTIVRGEGARLTDADGHEYVDFLGEYTAGLYGHSHPVIVDAIREALDDGIVFGAPNRYEIALAQAICERFPSVELVRFCNSGTEANLLALSLARVATGKPAIMVFEGGYHGGVFFFATRRRLADQRAVPVRRRPYNDAESAARLIAEHARRARGGDRRAACRDRPASFPASRRSSRALREATAAHDVLLVFDEVMTSRLSTGGLQQVLGITPDLTTLGQVPRRRARVRRVRRPRRPDAPVRPVASGCAAARRDVQQRGADDGRRRGRADAAFTRAAEVARLNGLGDRLRDRLNAFAAEHDLEFGATGYGSLVGLHFTRAPMRRMPDVPPAPELRALLHLHMLERGYSYARRGFIALSLPLEEADVDGFATAVEAFLL